MSYLFNSLAPQMTKVVARMLPPESNCVRLRWSGGTPSPTGEVSGEVLAEREFAALATSAKQDRNFDSYGALSDGALKLRYVVGDEDDRYLDEPLEIGDTVRYQGERYEVKEAGRLDYRGHTGPHWVMVEEVQARGDV